ncbi:hypothetical protein A6C57_01255 [Fibrella sp. ES10-3-2-2]|nr:hypothetical protein A6C57_01255 [Fibrella sp. ES10-3-2-2]
MTKTPVTHLVFEVPVEGKLMTINAMLENWHFVPRVGDRFHLSSLLNMANASNGYGYPPELVKQMAEAMENDPRFRTAWYNVDCCDVSFSDEFGDKGDYSLSVIAFLSASI